MKLVTGKQMAKIDYQAIHELGIPSLVLMENAGLQATQVIQRHFDPVAGKRVCIVCGKGNNGGDGMVVARHLANRGAKVIIFLLAEKTLVTDDTKVNMEIALSMDIALQEMPNNKELATLEQVAANSDFVVDAILGTGLRNAPRDFYQEVIKCLNTCRKPIISLDVPTGLSTSTGKILGDDCIHAQLTITFALPKVGLICSPNQCYVGQLEVVDISIPDSLIEKQDIRVQLLEEKHIKCHFKPRASDTHKGSFGHVLVIAGSPGKTGAGVMAAQAALRSGAGLVTLGVPKALHPVVEMKTTEVMTVGLAETKAHTLASQATEEILTIAQDMKAVAIGPGMSSHPETVALLKQLISNLTCPIVLDADGITNLTLTDLQYSKPPLIITPHPGEMARLLHISSQEVQEHRLEAVQKTAMTCHTYVVLKGKHTLISNPEGEVSVNPTGNPGMASAGTGDVLTGIIAGFMAQGFSPLAASQAGVFIHGLAGDLGCRQKGERGLIATDVLEQIPAAIKHLTGE